MKTNKKVTKGNSNAIVGTVAVAGAVALLGALFLYGSKDGKARAKKVKGWMLKAKGEVLEQVEGLKEVSEEAYGKIVEKVSKKYKTLMKNHESEVDLLATELKKYWKNFSSKKKPSKR